MKLRIVFLCLLIYGNVVSPDLWAQPNASVSTTVNLFLNTLNAAELKKTVYAFDDSLRHKWTNLPVGLVPRAGIQYGSLSDKSRLAFHRVLSSMLSSQGYLKTTSIMQLDDILNTLYQTMFEQGKIDQKTLKMTQDLKCAHGNYYISVWGKPQAKTPWGLNLGGHHIALSLTSDGENISMSPYFIGTDPSEVKFGKYSGFRVLSKEEDYGFMLINALSDAQKAVAVLKQAIPQDIITSPQSNQRITSYYGIAAQQFDETQKTLLKLLIQEYTHNFEHQKAHQLFDKIMHSGLEKVYFAWIGSLENNKPHYYIINGPDFLIEYDNVGFDNDGNHIHAILREKDNDFGEDILKRHYLENNHATIPAKDLKITFKLKITEIAHPDSVAVTWYLMPLSKGKTVQNATQGPFFMQPPGADGLYHLTVVLPDSVLGKTLSYRYQSADKRFEIRRNIRLDTQIILLTDNWGYADGLNGKVKPGQGIPVLQTNTSEEAKELAKPFVGITTDGKPVKNLFPLKKTGVSTKPLQIAVTTFLDALSNEQRAKCTFPIHSDEWRKWHNIESYQRTGIGLEEMTPSQKALAFGILEAGLSAKGFQKSKDIMSMEAYLAILTPSNKLLGGEKYWFTFMGTPSDTEPWGWQIDGHHLVINYFVLGDQVVMTPTFMGSEPTYIESGTNKGLRTYEIEEKKGAAFYASLSPEQKKKARLWHKKEFDFNRTEAFRDNEIVATTGISAKELSANQQKALLDLITEYVSNMKEGHAKVKMTEVKAHLNETHFTWVQNENPDSPFYYRIHSPVILIEFDHQIPVAIWDRSKVRPGPVKAHIHTVVRTPNGNDYGKDLLKEHLEKHHKH